MFKIFVLLAFINIGIYESRTAINKKVHTTSTIPTKPAIGTYLQSTN